MARARCCGSPLPSPWCPTCRPDIVVAPVEHLRERASEIAGRFFGEPSAHLAVAGITGTNGKTTCAYLLAQALEQAGQPAGYMGTIGTGRPGQLATSALTTGDAITVQRRLADLRAGSAANVAMEVSSHALDQSRVAAVRFRTAAFTNLTRDHLDYHGTMDSYGAAKARLFMREDLVSRVINVDDAFGRQLAIDPRGRGRLVVTCRGHQSRVRSTAWLRARHARRPLHARHRAGIRFELGHRRAHLSAGRRLQCRQPAHGHRHPARLGSADGAGAARDGACTGRARPHGDLRRRDMRR